MSASQEQEGNPVFVNQTNSNNFQCNNPNHKNFNSDSSSENLKNNQSTKSKSQSPSSGGGGEEQKNQKEDISDPFLAEFYRRKRNRPRLSERIFNRQPAASIFDNESSFVDDLRKQLDEERKMFFDADPFAHFQTRGGSPGPTAPPGTGSPRMGRAGAGFPFGENTARSRLDDFPGARHPMFSTMRRPAWEDDPFTAGSPFHRERNNSGSSGCASGSSTASAGEHEHIIPIRIERSDGSTTTTSNGHTTAHAKAAARASGSGQINNPISSTPIPMPAPEGMTAADPQPTQQNMQQIPGPQRSSTEVRKSPSPAVGQRSPRSQSAPPDSMTEGVGDKKFVSSVNIDIEPNNLSSPSPNVTQLGGNCTKEKTPPKDVSGRPIPIVVERSQGRPFVNNQRNGPIPQPDVPQPQQQKSSRPAEREVTPPPKKPTPPKDPLEKVVEISNDVKELELDVDQFTGTSRKDKEYLYLDEMLTRNLIKLDLIETEGREDIRIARKDCIRLIQNCISKLESKAPLPSQSEQAMELYQSSESIQRMDVDQPIEKSKSKESVPSGCGDNQSISSSKSESISGEAIPLGSGDSQSGKSVDVGISGEVVKVSG